MYSPPDGQAAPKATSVTSTAATRSLCTARS
jgi:hypothetical protein